MAPNPLAQEAVLREAYRQAAVSPARFSTSRPTARHIVGRPDRAKALVQCWASNVHRDALHLRSVKTNLGHLEAAAGVAA